MAAWYLALKDLRLLLRDRMALFWVLGFPVLFALFIGAVVRAGLSGDTVPLSVVLVDEGKTDMSQRIAAEIARHPRVRLRVAGAFEAREAVRRAEAVAYLHLPSRLGALPGVRAELGFDPAREIESAFLEQLFVQALARASGHAPAAVSDAGAIRKTQAALKADPGRATAIGQKLFPPQEAALIAELIRRDTPYYDATISPEFVAAMNRFARDVGILKGDPGYDQVVWRGG